MLNKIKGAFLSAVNNLDPPLDRGDGDSSARPADTIIGKPMFSLPSHLKRYQDRLKYRYTRPAFLQLNTDDEILVSADQVIRPIIVPRDIAKLSWNSGYAETVNAGKSFRNEDQAAIYKGLLRATISKEIIQNKLVEMVSIRLRPSKPQRRTTEMGRLYRLRLAHSKAPPATTAPTTTTIDDMSDIEVINEPENSESTDKSLDLNAKLTDSTTSSEGDQPTNIKPDWAEVCDDLMSPTTPLPSFISESTSPTELTAPVIPIPSPNMEESKKSFVNTVEESLPYVYFALFDGHAGSEVAVAASNRLHRIVHEKLQNVADLLIAFGIENNPSWFDMDEDVNDTVKGSVFVPKLPSNAFSSVHDPVKDKTVTVDNLIIGALEKAFWEMDQEIERDKIDFYMRGGCTALVALFILGKLYLANAGDSRAIVYKNSQIIPMSFDFTPESERERIKYLGLLKPEYLGNDFTHLEFIRRPNRKDLGKDLLYRDAFMTGWAYKCVTPDDLKFPLIFGEGKRSRVAATIGVTRGFGDHELKVANTDVFLKPFLTCQPEVKILDLENDESLTDSDLLIMGTDGLWDVTNNEEAAEIVQKALDHFPVNDPQRLKYRYISAAQDLVMHSRGKSKENGAWVTSSSKSATIDDISTFVIPLKPYQQEYIKWKEARRLVTQKASDSTATSSTESK